MANYIPEQKGFSSKNHIDYNNTYKFFFQGKEYTCKTIAQHKMAEVSSRQIRKNLKKYIIAFHNNQPIKINDAIILRAIKSKKTKMLTSYEKQQLKNSEDWDMFNKCWEPTSTGLDKSQHKAISMTTYNKNLQKDLQK